jgi:hypothetical protein
MIIRWRRGMIRMNLKISLWISRGYGPGWKLRCERIMYAYTLFTSAMQQQKRLELDYSIIIFELL